METITALIHEHKYDRLNDSNNSNNGREIKHVLERPYKRKWSEKTGQEKVKENRKRKSSNKETTDADNAGHQTGPDNTYVQRVKQNAETAKERTI